MMWKLNLVLIMLDILLIFCKVKVVLLNVGFIIFGVMKFKLLLFLVENVLLEFVFVRVVKFVLLLSFVFNDFVFVFVVLVLLFVLIRIWEIWCFFFLL